jgi:hypothetical protein
MDRFNVGRAGDHLITPFQCDLCHFRKIYGRNDVATMATDQEVMGAIRRANLDALWSREPLTVRANLAEAVRMEKYADRVGMPSITPVMGPFPLRDDFGIKGALALLDRPLDPGVYEEFVQWDTFRRSRSVVTSILQAGVTGLSDVIGAYKRNRVRISDVATHSLWYSRFANGVHKSVRQIRKQDKEVTIEALHAVHLIFERKWKKGLPLLARKKVAEMGSWFVAGFYTALRREEMLLVEYAETAQEVRHLAWEVDLYFAWVISGRTKGNQVSGNKFKAPCLGTAGGTGLQSGKWVTRLLGIIKSQRRQQGGHLFMRNMSIPKLMEYQDDLYRLLEKVQATTKYIEESVDVRDAYGIFLYRGVMAHARNMGLHKDFISAINRWRTEMNSGDPSLDLPDTYASLEASLPLLLKYSQDIWTNLVLQSREAMSITGGYGGNSRDSKRLYISDTAEAFSIYIWLFCFSEVFWSVWAIPRDVEERELLHSSISRRLGIWGHVFDHESLWLDVGLTWLAQFDGREFYSRGMVGTEKPTKIFESTI